MNCIKRCVVCKEYTIDRTHCGKDARTPHPPRYTVEDKYAKYRREGMCVGRKVDVHD